MSAAHLDNRIDKNPILRRLYGRGAKRPVGSEDILLRRPADAPLSGAMTPEEQREFLRKQDREITLKGFESLGVAKETVDKLRKLDGLATTAGQFLSVSVTTSYQMFMISSIHLFEETEKLRDQLNAENLSADQRLMLRRLYLDYSREVTRSHQIQFEAAAALVQLQQGAQGRSKPSPARPRGRANARQQFSEGDSTPGE